MSSTVPPAIQPATEASDAPGSPPPSAAAQASLDGGLPRDLLGPGQSTPSFLRRWNVILLVLVAAFAVVGSLASLVMRSASITTADNTAPALVGIQEVFASVAEANTAATAAFLAADATGEADRINDNLFRAGLQRAVGQAEQVSATIGPDPEAHQALQDIAVDLNAYRGGIEAARVQNLADLPDADVQLRTALGLVQTDIAASVTTVTEQGRANLEDERTTGQLFSWIAVAIGVVTLVSLIVVQVGLLRRTNRVLNPLLVLATALVATVVGYLVVGPLARAQALDDASAGGYDAIATTSGIQTSAFDLQSRLSLKILDGRGDDLEASFADVETQIEALATGADSAREQAAADTLRIRWDRYQETAREIETLVDIGDRTGAVERFQGEGLATFNGLNTAVESALSDNRDQFLAGVDLAADAVGTTPYLTVVLPVLAALAILLAIQRRLAEYR